MTRCLALRTLNIDFSEQSVIMTQAHLKKLNLTPEVAEVICTGGVLPVQTGHRGQIGHGGDQVGAARLGVAWPGFPSLPSLRSLLLLVLQLQPETAE